MSKADSVLCWGYKVKRVNKVKHVFVVSIREGQVQHEWINEKVCACMRAHLCVCWACVWKGKYIVCGCCIFDELALHNGPVEGCRGSFQAGITRQVSASTFKAASYNNFSKKIYIYIFVRAAETVLGQQTPPSCRRVTRSKLRAVGFRMQVGFRMLLQTFLCPGSNHVQNILLDMEFLRWHQNNNQVTFSKLLNVHIQWITCNNNNLLPHTVINSASDGVF